MFRRLVNQIQISNIYGNGLDKSFHRFGSIFSLVDFQSAQSQFQFQPVVALNVIVIGPEQIARFEQRRATQAIPNSKSTSNIPLQRGSNGWQFTAQKDSSS
jgi:hypothetical protein